MLPQSSTGDKSNAQCQVWTMTSQNQPPSLPLYASFLCWSHLALFHVVLTLLANPPLLTPCILKHKSEKPGAPGKGAAKFASLIQELEAKHIGRKGGPEYGYERDGFVVSDVRMELFNLSACAFTRLSLCNTAFSHRQLLTFAFL